MTPGFAKGVASGHFLWGGAIWGPSGHVPLLATGKGKPQSLQF